MELKKYKLSDFLDSYGDGIHGTPTYSNNGEYYFVNGNNLNNGEIIITPETQKITKTEYEKIKRPLSTQTILLSINGTLGKLAYYKDEKIALGKSACYLNVKQEYDKHYVHYILCTENFKQYMLKVASGSTIKNFAPKQAAEYEFYAPSVEYQRKIASVLSSLDNKIALNRRINAKLEQIAKRLYDYWFVQFNFPDKNGKPYKSSGGKMVWNEVLKREVPEGWEVKKLGDVLSLLKDGTHNPPKRVECGVALLTGTMFGNNFLDHSKATYISENDYMLIHSRYSPQEGDIVITKIGTLGNVNYLRKSDIPIAIHCNSALLRFPSYIGSLFAFYFCKSDLFQMRLKAVKGQSIQEFVSLNRLASIYMEIPPQDIITAFNAKTLSIFNYQLSIEKETAQLTALRDRLLPLLMNGQVEVKG